jgi:hypothetical protein
MKLTPALVPKSVGADPKRMAVLGGLVLVLGVVYWINRTPSAPEGASVAATQPVPAPAAATRSANPFGPRTAPQALMPPQRAQTRGENSVQDFRPTLKLPEGTDVSRIDPTLKLDLLDRVQSVPMEGGSRSLFEFSQPPAPKTPPPPVKPINPGPVTTAASTPPPTPPADPPKPPPPPIPLKFYGYVNNSRSGPRRAFFLDGDDIFVAGENELIRNRYKIIRVGVNSAVVEDTTNKNQQTLPLVEELSG